MKTRRFLKLTGSGIMIFLLAGGCSLDDSPVGPAVISETTSTYTIAVSVIPSSAFRTTGTWNAWVNPVQTEFVMVLDDAAHDDDHADLGVDDHMAGEDMHDEGGEHAEDELHHGDIQIGDVTLDGIRIVMTADNAGADMYHVHHGAIEHVEAPHDARLFSVHLYDALHERAGHGATNIGYSDVVLNAVNEAESHAIKLRPVHTPEGFRYEANAALPLGMWDLHVEAEPPAFVRLAGYETKWVDHLEAEFHDFSMAGELTSEIEIGAVETGGLKFELSAGAVAPFGAIGTGAIPLMGDENIRFSLAIEDHAVEGPAEDLLYATVQIRITHDATGESVFSILEPVYGSTGFHYAANLVLPAGAGPVADATDPVDDGHDGH